jgi:PAS domain-containing protein
MRATRSASGLGLQRFDARTAGGRRALQSLVEFAPNAIVVVGVDGRIETFNREGDAASATPRRGAGAAAGILVPERLRPQHAAHRHRFFADRLSAEPVRMGAGSAPMAAAATGEFPVEVNLSAVRTDQGTKVLAVISDITERHRLQQEVERARSTSANATAPRRPTAPRAISWPT